MKFEAGSTRLFIAGVDTAKKTKDMSISELFLYIEHTNSKKVMAIYERLIDMERSKPQYPEINSNLTQ